MLGYRPRYNLFSEATGDGPVNGSSIPMNNIFRMRTLVHGNGAGDPGITYMINNQITPGATQQVRMMTLHQRHIQEGVMGN
jgi:hypothetical protein